jgi:hypothetical protein
MGLCKVVEVKYCRKNGEMDESQRSCSERLASATDSYNVPTKKAGAGSPDSHRFNLILFSIQLSESPVERLRVAVVNAQAARLTTTRK